MIPFPLDLLGKGMGIHRQFHRPIIGDNGCRYSPHQLVDRRIGVFNRLLCRALYLLVKAILTDVFRQFHIPIGEKIGSYRSTISHTYWSQKKSIDNSPAYRSQ